MNELHLQTGEINPIVSLWVVTDITSQPITKKALIPPTDVTNW